MPSAVSSEHPRESTGCLEQLPGLPAPRSRARLWREKPGNDILTPAPKETQSPCGEQVWAVPGKSDDLAEVRSSHAPRPPRNRPWESLASAAAWRSPLGGDREHEQMGGEHRSDISAAVNGNLVTIKTTGNICMKWRQKGGLLRAGPPGPAPRGGPAVRVQGMHGELAGAGRSFWKGPRPGSFGGVLGTAARQTGDTQRDVRQGRGRASRGKGPEDSCRSAHLTTDCVRGLPAKVRIPA